MNVSLFTIQFLIQYLNDEICEKIKVNNNGELSRGNISLSIEHNYDGTGLYLLNYDESKLGPNKLRIIRDCVDEVFSDLVHACEYPVDEDIHDPNYPHP